MTSPHFETAPEMVARIDRLPYDSTTRNQVERVQEQLQEYAPDTFLDDARTASRLHPLTEQLYRSHQPQRQRVAALALNDFFNATPDALPEKTKRYVGTLLGDIPFIDASARTFETRLLEYGIRPDLRTASTDPSTWLSLRVGANIPEMSRVCRSTNVETQLTRAAFALDAITYPQSDDIAELLSKVLEVESYHTGFFEIFGLHAWDMLAQSAAGKLRTLHAGDEETLEYARATLGAAKKLSVDEILGAVFATDAAINYDYRTEHKDRDGESIIFASSPLDQFFDEGGSTSGELKMRFKTVGKYALKLLGNRSYDRDSGELPCDVFGLLAIADDADELGRQLAHVLGRVEKNRQIAFTTAASKRAPIYIKGTAEYIQSICRHIPSEIVHTMTEINEVTDDPRKIYQVAKFTARLSKDGTTLPFEFQFQTKSDRENARLGYTAHMNHNAGDGLASTIPGAHADLHGMFQRSKEIDRSGERLLLASLLHGDAFRRQVQNVLGRQ